MARVRYDGPHRAVRVIHPTTNEQLAVVKRGELLPDDVPDEIGAELAAREDWTAVADVRPKSVPKMAQKPKEGDD